MNHFCRISFFCLFFLLFPIVIFANIGVQFEPAVTELRLVLDDFEDGDEINRIDGATGTWNLAKTEAESFCHSSIVDVVGPELSQKSLLLEYDVDSKYKAQNGFWFQLAGIDVSHYDYLEFFVKGDSKKGFAKSSLQNNKNVALNKKSSWPKFRKTSRNTGSM